MSNNALFKACKSCALTNSRHFHPHRGLAAGSLLLSPQKGQQSRWQSNIFAGVAIASSTPPDIGRLNLALLKPATPQTRSTIRQVLVCVTPGLVRNCFSEHASPSRHLVQQLFANATPKQQVQTVTAVVDGVRPPSQACPEDGLSYLAGAETEMNITTVPKSAGLSGRMKDVAAGFVSSDLSLLSFDLGAIASTEGAGIRAKASAAQADMLLASTTFTQGSQGHASILLREFWEKDDGSDTWIRIESELCESATVIMHASEPTSAQFMASLLPLTVPRVISAGLGNVISQLAAAPDSTEPPFAASGELEKAVSHFFVARSQLPRPVQAWALVLPEELVSDAMSSIGGDIEARWTSSHPQSVDIIALALRGARLHKVLSGGGGWGKKAGLLSLDPETSFARSSEPEEEMFRFMSAGADQASMLGEVAKVGDYVQFFIYDDEDPYRAAQRLTEGCHTDALRLVLGTNDGEAQRTLSQDSTGPTKNSGDSWSIKTGGFSALSESGFSVTLTVNGSNTIRSKLDVPNSVLTLDR